LSTLLAYIQITIHDEYASPFWAIEEQLQKKFDLIDAICIESSDRGLQSKLLGMAAAKYLSRIIQPKDTICVSAGTTVHEIAANFPKQNQMINIKFIPLVGVVLVSNLRQLFVETEIN